MTEKIFVIAEAGVNHNGSLARAMQLVDVAVDANADAVKFQTFRASALVGKHAEKASYQSANMKNLKTSQLEMLQALELGEADHIALSEHCDAREIEFMSTPFDLQSASFLLTELNMKRIKVSSGDLTNAPFLHALARFNKPVILSSGMMLMGEIEQALSVMAHGFTAESAPSKCNFRTAYSSPEGQAALSKFVSILHCTTEYPAALDTVNLRAMDSIRSAFRLKTGYSDHTQGIWIAMAAASRGAKIVEKHFTLDRELPGPDHKASLEPDELSEMIAAIRAIEVALGSPVKIVAPAEQDNRRVATKSITAASRIEAGEIFTAENITTKRPADGLPPLDWWEVIGKQSRRAFDRDDPITND